MTDKRAFEALLDEYVHRYVEALDATDGVGTEEAKQARAAVLAAYDAAAGREAPAVAPLDEFNKVGGDLVVAEHVANAYNWFNDGWYARGKYTHPAPKADEVEQKYPDDLGVWRDAKALSARCQELAQRLVPKSDAAADWVKRLQKKCVDWDTYWQAPDSHGVDLSVEQAIVLLQDVLGVEVEIAASPARVGPEV